MKYLRDIEYLNGVRVMVRADFNVPIIKGKITDDFRIRAALPTIEYLKMRGAKIILVSHLESNDDENASLRPVADRLKTLGIPSTFIANMREAHSHIMNMNGGSCVLLENIRLCAGEKDGDEKLSKELASLADIYVNEAFSVSHRKHSSVVGVPKYLDSYAGIQFEREIANLSKAFDPAHPFVFVLGGAKFDTKLPLLDRFLETADTVFLGGALANDLLKARGVKVGKSLVSDGKSKEIRVVAQNEKVLLPIDVIDQDHSVRSLSSFGKEDKIMDIGPVTLSVLKEKIRSAKFILWNGPMGVYENGFQGATLEVARMIAEATAQNGAESIVGGGDTLSAIEALGIGDKFSFVSTGGGAMLQYLAEGTLPGIEVIR